MFWPLYTRKSVDSTDFQDVLNGLIDDYNRRLPTDGALLVARRTVANVNVTVNPNDFLIAYTTLTAGRAVTLPNPTTVGSSILPRVYVVKDEAGTAGANNITISVSGGANIDGAATKVINTNYGSVRLYSNGTAYFTSA